MRKPHRAAAKEAAVPVRRKVHQCEGGRWAVCCWLSLSAEARVAFRFLFQRFRYETLVSVDVVVNETFAWRVMRKLLCLRQSAVKQPGTRRAGWCLPCFLLLSSSEAEAPTEKVAPCTMTMRGFRFSRLGREKLIYLQRCMGVYWWLCVSTCSWLLQCGSLFSAKWRISWWRNSLNHFTFYCSYICWMWMNNTVFQPTKEMSIVCI